MSVYVCSDIHGWYDLYSKMREDKNIQPDDKIIILGDIIDRGPDSIKLLLEVIDQPNVICLLGNHELMMWDALFNKILAFQNRDHSLYWFNSSNKGKETLAAFKNLTDKEKDKIRNFIKNMYLQYEIKLDNHTYLLSHSSFIKGKGTLLWKDVDYDDVFDAVWNSPWRKWEFEPRRNYEDGRIHVIGHVPVQAVFEQESLNFPEEVLFDPYGKPEAFVRKSVVNIDCGCALRNRDIVKYSGLCCMDLNAHDRGEPCFSYYVVEEKEQDKILVY